MSRNLIGGGLLVLWVTGCSSVMTGSTTANGQQATSDTVGVALPEGEGKGILERACTSCHDLAGLTLYQGYYDEELWRGVIVDMVRVGAHVREEEIEVLAKYLDTHFGTGG